MAICHIAIKQGTRSSGQSAEAKEDYLKRNGKYGGKDGKKKEDVFLAESGNMPDWVKTSKEYWQAADTFERANGRLFLQVEFALPVELSRETQIELSREFAEKLTGPSCLPYTMAIHTDDPNNPHCHLMISERQNDGISRSPDTWFRKADAKSNPGAKKTDEFQKLDSYWNMRLMWAEMANNALERAGRGERLDPRTLEAQGIDREAQIHEGRNPERKARNREIKGRNERREALKRQITGMDAELRELEELERETVAVSERKADIKPSGDLPDLAPRTPAEILGSITTETKKSEIGLPPRVSENVRAGAALAEAAREGIDIQSVMLEGRAAFREKYAAWKKTKAEEQERERIKEQRKIEREREAKRGESERGGYSR